MKKQKLYMFGGSKVAPEIQKLICWKIMDPEPAMIRSYVSLAFIRPR